MALTIGQRAEDRSKKSLKVEEEIFSTELNIWALRNLLKLLQGLGLERWADIDGLHWEREVNSINNKNENVSLLSGTEHVLC